MHLVFPQDSCFLPPTRLPASASADTLRVPKAESDGQHRLSPSSRWASPRPLAAHPSRTKVHRAPRQQEVAGPACRDALQSYRVPFLRMLKVLGHLTQAGDGLSRPLFPGVTFASRAPLFLSGSISSSIGTAPTHTLASPQTEAGCHLPRGFNIAHFSPWWEKAKCLSFTSRPLPSQHHGRLPPGPGHLRTEPCK